MIALRAAVAVAAGAVAATAAAAPLFAARPPALPRPSVFCFYANDAGRGLARLQVVVRRIQVLAPEWYSVDVASATPRGEPEAAALALARDAHVPVWPVINTQTGGRSAIADPGVQARLIAALSGLADSEGYDGLTLDFEGISAEQRDAYSAFVAGLAAALHAHNRKLAVFVVRRTATGASSVARAFDWNALTATADLVLASSYSEHWETPGPVATSKGFAAFLTYAHSVSPAKVAPVLGAFGYDWKRGAGAPTPIAASDAAGQGRILGQRTADHGYVATYTRGADVVWYPTAAGLVAEANAVRAARMRWLALFSLGREQPEFWLQPGRTRAARPR